MDLKPKNSILRGRNSHRPRPSLRMITSRARRKGMSIYSERLSINLIVRFRLKRDGVLKHPVETFVLGEKVNPFIDK